MTPPWYRGRLAAFDMETTGVDPCEARIVTAAVGVVGGGATPSWRSLLVDPGIEIPAEASAIHGVTTERARAEGTPAMEAVATLAEELADIWHDGMPVVIFNATYDLTVMRSELRRHGLPPLVVGPVIDPLVLDRGCDRYRKGSRKLDAMCAHYGAKLDQAHDAASDALAAARVAYVLAQRYPRVAYASLDELQDMQRRWAAEWHTALEARKRQSDPAAVVARGWPMQDEAGPTEVT